MWSLVLVLFTKLLQYSKNYLIIKIHKITRVKNYSFGGDSLFIIILGTLSDSEKDLVDQIFKDSNIKLYNISFQILHSHSDAEEAVSQTFLKIINHIDKISTLPCPKIAPYCVVIVKNESANILRKRRMRFKPIKVVAIIFILLLFTST